MDQFRSSYDSQTAVATQSPYFPKSSSFQAVDLGPNSHFQVDQNPTLGVANRNTQEKPGIIVPQTSTQDVYEYTSNTLQRAKQSKTSWR